MKKGSITFVFDVPGTDGEITQATLSIGYKDDGEPCVTLYQLGQLLFKALATLSIVAAGNQKDALRAACQCSSLMQQSMDAAVDGDYKIQIHLESKPENLN
jgi:hypothetical protein